MMKAKIPKHSPLRGFHAHKHHEFDRITPYIYIGTNFCCRPHFLQIKKLGIQADFDLEAERIERLTHDLKYYLWLPVKDHYAPTKTQFEIGTSFLDSLVRAKKKVYVHCKNGHGRSPTMVVAYFISQGMTAKEAIAFIKKRRPEMHLWKAQIRALKMFYKRKRIKK